MLQNKSVAVVVPAYNEASQIGIVIESMPDYVDRIIVVNDKSADNTAEIVKSYQGKYPEMLIPKIPRKAKKNIYSKADEIVAEFNLKEIEYFVPSKVVHPNISEKIVLIDLLKNAGVGGAIARGYKWAKDNNIDCTAVMAGDGQMDPDELKGICLPVVENGVDYVKGNRLSHKSARVLIPKTRFFGNSVLSILTKIASGYWHVSDTQTGYTAISLRALNLIDLYKIYPRYGMPNDMLVKLNIVDATLKEIPIKPIYHVGEQSKMKIKKVIPKISWLLVRNFYKRIWKKYLLKSFHPLFILYHLGFLLLLFAFPYGIKIFIKMFKGIDANPVTVLAFAVFFIGGFQSMLFAMWMDIQDNEHLNK